LRLCMLGPSWHDTAGSSRQAATGVNAIKGAELKTPGYYG
jgi:hypothetical protein